MYFPPACWALESLFLFIQIIGPVHENEFSLEDFDLLEQITLSAATLKIKSLIKEMGIDSKRYYLFSYLFKIFSPHIFPRKGPKVAYNIERQHLKFKTMSNDGQHH